MSQSRLGHLRPKPIFGQTVQAKIINDSIQLWLLTVMLMVMLMCVQLRNLNIVTLQLLITLTYNE